MPYDAPPGSHRSEVSQTSAIQPRQEWCRGSESGVCDVFRTLRYPDHIRPADVNHTEVKAMRPRWLETSTLIGLAAAIACGLYLWWRG